MRYERWKATIPGLTDFFLKVAFARCEICEQPAEELAAALEVLCHQVDDAVETARDILMAFVPVLIDPDHLEPIQAVRHAARDASLPAVSRLLRCSSRQGHLLDSAPPTSTDQRTLTLGERRALARKPSRALLAKLLNDPHPMVAELLLQNPRITEGDVITMAARRPATPGIVLEIGKRWSRRPRVRMALALNPAAPPALVVPLLGLLVRPELAEVASAADLLPVVRVTAKELWDLRPPLRPVPAPGLSH